MSQLATSIPSTVTALWLILADTSATSYTCAEERGQLAQRLPGLEPSTS